jgi:hypothetical protein
MADQAQQVRSDPVRTWLVAQGPLLPAVNGVKAADLPVEEDWCRQVGPRKPPEVGSPARPQTSPCRALCRRVHPGPPGVDLPDDADPLAAWDDFLARVGVPEEQRNTRSAIEDPDGHGPRLFFQQVLEGKFLVQRLSSSALTCAKRLVRT